MKEVLKIFLWGMEIGRLMWHEGRHLSYFNYNPEFLRGNLDIAPLTASIHHPLSTRAIFGETERIYQKLPSFIADSLPDAWGNQLFDQWRKENHLSERSVTSLEKLAFIGKRRMGALEFVPEIDRGAMTDKIDIKAIHNQGYETIKLPFYYFFAFPKGTDPELVQAFTDAVKDIVENDAEYQGKIYSSYYQRPFFKGTGEGLKIYADIDELLGKVNLTGKL